MLIEATVRVARSLGMGTVAEGIETEGQAEVLTRLQCDKGQGYLFAKPLAADLATRWLMQQAQALSRTPTDDRREKSAPIEQRLEYLQ